MLWMFGIPTIRTKQQIERVQRRATRWTICNFNTRASVSNMIETLGWRSLEQRRANPGLWLFCKIVNNTVAVPFLTLSNPTGGHPSAAVPRPPHRFSRQLLTRKDFYKFSFFPLAVVQLNVLPESAVSLPSVDIFKAKTGKLQAAKQINKKKKKKKKKKKVREKFRECHSHKPQPIPDTKRKRKQTKPNKRKSNKRTKSTKTSSLSQAR